METKRASNTAGYTAAMRAIADLAPEKKKILTDPYAMEFLDYPWSLTHLLFQLKIFNPLIYQVGTKVPDIMVGFPGMMALASIRHRYIDDKIVAAYQHGIRQFIILGAGYDSRAFRLPLQDAHFIEIDHPNTQSRKQKIIRRKKLRPSCSLEFISSDFSSSWAVHISDQLKNHGIFRQEASMIIWEGVSCYLKPEAVNYTFKTVSNFLLPDSIFIFDAFTKDIMNPHTHNPLVKKMQTLVERKGEPFYWGADPDEIEKTLLNEEFKAVRSHTILDINNALAKKSKLKLKPYDILYYLNMIECHK